MLKSEQIIGTEREMKGRNEGEMKRR